MPIPADSRIYLVLFRKDVYTAQNVKDFSAALQALVGHSMSDIFMYQKIAMISIDYYSYVSIANYNGLI
jgi:hypothetical protein